MSSSPYAYLHSHDTVLCSVCMTGASGRDDGALLSPAQLRSIREHIKGIAHSFCAWEDSQQLQQPGGSRRQSLRPGVHAHAGCSQDPAQALPGAGQPKQRREPGWAEQVAGQLGQFGLPAWAGAERLTGLESDRLQRTAGSGAQVSEQTAAEATDTASAYAGSSMPCAHAAPPLQGRQPAAGQTKQSQASLAKGLLPIADAGAAAFEGGSRADALVHTTHAQMQWGLTQDARPAERRRQQSAEAMDGAAHAQRLWDIEAALPGKRRLRESGEAEPVPKRPCWSSQLASRGPHQARGPWLQLAPTPGRGLVQNAHSNAAALCQGARAQACESMQAGSRVRMKRRKLVPVQSLLASTSQPPGSRAGPPTLLSGASPAISQGQMQSAW